MGRSFKDISRLSHENYNQSIQKCGVSIFQKGASIKFCNSFTCSYYCNRWLGITKWRGFFLLNNLDELLYFLLLDLMRLRTLLQRISFQLNMKYTIMLIRPLVFLLTNRMIDVWLKHQLVNWYSLNLIIFRWSVIIQNKCLWIFLWQLRNNVW